ncbi:exonuclease domain-containing protein [Actinoalloteichus hoggarensis]|nr:exonuclease domain-containing protein [Actinoalloteichus hoggarensis]
MRFAAFDTETANEKRGSVCSVGLVVVDGGRVVRRYSTLCRPPAGLDYFAPRNTAVHGITEDRVHAAPAFAEVLAELVVAVGDRVLVAHNASFDISVIRQACDQEGLAYPALRFGCTWTWAKRLLDIPRHRLPDVARHLGLPLGTHHDAADDAEACAGVCLELMRRTGVGSVEELAVAAGGTLRSLGLGPWNPVRPSRIVERPAAVVPPIG